MRLVTATATAAAALLLAAFSPAQTEGTYTVRVDQPRQVIKGLGFEIQSDSIGSGNAGMPDEVTAAPHDLTDAEKMRFYREMLHGFRYTRLAMGLYLRGLDAEKKQIVERYPGQMKDLRTMQNVAGIEGFNVEYWSPAPFWKTTKSYYGGTVGPVTPAYLESFSTALVNDLRYLRANGLRVAQWGLQNEPVVILDHSAPPKPGDALDAGLKAQSYSTCKYAPADYLAVMQAAVPKIRAAFPGVEIHANSWSGPTGPYADAIRTDPGLLKQVDAWTWHQIGHNSNDQITLRDKYLQGAGGKPVYQNEFEYQPWDTKLRPDDYFMNTGQALMNWMVFEDSPVWYWLHALKPVTNVEATGYSLGFWRPAGELKQNLRPNLPAGHWEFNPKNWNAIAGFLKYLGWDSTRLQVDESTVQNDQRIMVWRTRAGRLSVALSNRGTQPYTFHLHGMPAGTFTGHRYIVTALNTSLGTQSGGDDIAITVQPQSYEFWIANGALPGHHSGTTTKH